MKIKSIWSDISGFRQVDFKGNFSIILGVSKSSGEGKSHNLGKTTLVAIIDNMLFGARESERLKSIKNAFDRPRFFIKLEMNGQEVVYDVDYSKARKPLFSKEVKQNYEYFIRFQDDYNDEFRKISVRGKDATWKPLLLRLMGFDESSLIEKYEVESAIDDYKSFIQVAVAGAKKRVGNKKEIDAMLEQKTAILRSIESLDLVSAEESISKSISSELDVRIEALKKDLFVKRKELASINEALKSKVFVDFSVRKLEAVYNDLGVYFGGQLKQDFDSVEQFFIKVTNNRTAALNTMKNKLITDCAVIESELSILADERARGLKIIVEPKSVEVYKQLSNQLAYVESRLALLEQDVYKESVQQAEKEKRILEDRRLSLVSEVATEIDEHDQEFSKVNKEYSSIMKEVMDIDARLMIEKNSTGNLNFRAVSWRNGRPSDELKGEMAKKVSCAAFDVALRIVNNDDAGFVIHDGVIDDADKNTKAKFISAMKSRAELHDFQYILTAIYGELPDVSGDVAIILSDASESGLLMGRAF
ncbi:DUF2326 domain-containing protein [Pseudomonas aeruginosa]|uniref:DUF2326 domain-containing protein n=1 Tax=Pseudomonas aeruginosa TaxID=287 RepID=UPI001C9D92E7|nr:DUF2326 domain-containing protein [Pseudomonas aeruginosa]MBY9629741.1 DUF2326 domain-containing protein [Pseudomonas aeruginosa]QZV35567.1 DUF2326 domain-containing protein [Pseudomonas aeruginosa]